MGARPQRVCFLDWRAASATITNLGIAPVFLGDASVSPSGPNAKHVLAGRNAVTILDPGPVYGVAAADTTVTYLIRDLDD